LKKKGRFWIFSGSSELWVDPAGRLVFFRSITGSDFECDRPTPLCWVWRPNKTQSVGSCCWAWSKDVRSWWRKDSIGCWVMVVGRAQRCWVFFNFRSCWAAGPNTIAIPIGSRRKRASGPARGRTQRWWVLRWIWPTLMGPPRSMSQG